MKKLIIFSICILSTAIPGFAESWSQAYNRIEKLYNSGSLNEALEIAIPFAQQGNAFAQNIVGCLFLDKNEIEKARLWYDKAIMQGEVNAMYNMGFTYDGVNSKTAYGDSRIPLHLQNLNQAKHYYRMAMETKDNSEKSKFDAYINYASILFNNENKKQEAVELLQSCLRSTEYGAIRWLLGQMFEKMGRGTDAFRMYRIGAEYGDMNALYTLGLAYMNPSNFKGLSITKNTRAAVDCFTKIAEINDPKFNDTFGSRTGRALRYLNSLCSDLYYETYDESYLKQSIKWGSRCIGDLWVNDELKSIYQEGLSDSKQFNTFESWLKHIENKYAVDSDVDIDVPIANNYRDKTFVLIVANENYEFEAKVPFASRDGNIFFKYVNQALGVPKENIRLLTDVTLNKFKYEISWLKDVLDSHPESNAIVYYAGHGLPSEDSSTSYLLPSDGYAKNVNSGLDINEIIATISDYSNHSIFIFDACFSGAKRDGNMISSARGVAIKQSNPRIKNNTIVFSACSGTETAYSFDDQQHGLFTYFFLKSLKESKGNITLGQLAENVISEVRRASIDINGKIQTPNVAVSDDIKTTWKNLAF